MTKIKIDISDIDAKFWEDVEREKAIRRANQVNAETLTIQEAE